METAGPASRSPSQNRSVLHVSLYSKRCRLSITLHPQAALDHPALGQGQVRNHTEPSRVDEGAGCVPSIRNDLTHIKGSEVAMPVRILSPGSRPLLASGSTKARLPIKKSLPDRHGVQALSRCQQRIIVLVAQGLKNCEIAKEIGISVNVVKNYLQTIYDRIGMSNRVELALWYEARVHEGSSLLLS